LVAPPSASGSARWVRRRRASETGSCEADMLATFPPLRTLTPRE
jgi:hypothetical protein